MLMCKLHYVGDGDDDVLPYPVPTVSKAVKREKHEKYFVLTSAEVYSAKLKRQEEKQQKEKDKEQRKIQREINAMRKKDKKLQEQSSARQMKKSVLVETNRPRPTDQSSKKAAKCTERNKTDRPRNRKLKTKYSCVCGIVYKSKEDYRKNEDWLKCKVCCQWFHESCAEQCGVLDDSYFTCKQCL